ncbi:MAG: hypothetical protein R3E32_03695 [Chitinophagales bacterium]
MKIFQKFFVFLVCLSILFVFQSESILAANVNSSSDDVQSVKIIKAVGRIVEVLPEKGAKYSIQIVVEDNGNLPNEIEVGLMRYVKTNAADPQNTAVGVLGTLADNDSSNPSSRAYGALRKMPFADRQMTVFELVNPQTTNQKGLQVGDAKVVKLSSDVIEYTLGDNTASRRPLTCVNEVCDDWGCMCKIEMERPW